MIAINFGTLLLHCKLKKKKTTKKQVAFSLAALAYENIILNKNGQGTDEET